MLYFHLKYSILKLHTLTHFIVDKINQSITSASALKVILTYLNSLRVIRKMAHRNSRDDKRKCLSSVPDICLVCLFA